MKYVETDKLVGLFFRSSPKKNEMGEMGKVKWVVKFPKKRRSKHLTVRKMRLVC